MTNYVTLDLHYASATKGKKPVKLGKLVLNMKAYSDQASREENALNVALLVLPEWVKPTIRKGKGKTK